MEDNEVILSRIKKLLSLSTSSNPNEAASAAAKAQEMLLKYNLSMVQVEGYENIKTEPITESYESFGENIVEWKVYLANAVARSNLCRIFTSGNRLVWVGKESNIQVARYLSNTLANDLERLATEYWNGILMLRKINPLLLDYEQRTIHGRTWKKSFYFGAIEVIKQRLNASKWEMTKDPNMSALIVTEDDATERYLRDNYNLTNRGRRTSMSGAGYASGREAGGSVSFKTGVSAGGSYGTRQIRG